MAGDERQLPAGLVAALAANRDQPDAALEALCRWHLTQDQLAAWACKRIVSDFRKTSPAPVVRPQLLFVGDRDGRR